MSPPSTVIPLCPRGWLSWKNAVSVRSRLLGFPQTPVPMATSQQVRAMLRWGFPVAAAGGHRFGRTRVIQACVGTPNPGCPQGLSCSLWSITGGRPLCRRQACQAQGGGTGVVLV